MVHVGYGVSAWDVLAFADESAGVHSDARLLGMAMVLEQTAWLERRAGMTCCLQLYLATRQHKTAWSLESCCQQTRGTVL